MKTKILGLAFLAILAINAIALTATASAEVLLTTLLPAPVKPITFTDEGGLSELVPLKTKLGAETNVKCLKVTSKGEFTTNQLGKGEIKFEECEITALKAKCEDLTNKIKGTIVVKGTLHLQTGLLEKVEEEGKKLKPVAVPAFVVLPEALHFLCGASTLLLILQSEKDPSCVAGEFLKPNELVKVLEAQFIEEEKTEGDQDIRKVFDDKDKEYGCQLFFEVNESGVLLDGAIVFVKNEVKLKEFKENGVELKSVLVDF